MFVSSCAETSAANRTHPAEIDAVTYGYVELKRMYLCVEVVVVLETRKEGVRKITYGAVNFEVMDRMSFDFSDCFVRNLLRLNLLKAFVVVVSLLSIVEILCVLIFKISLSLSLSL